ncbi:MAG: hypothetical protein AAGJ40_05625 [Planctomycetota bacterium]
MLQIRDSLEISPGDVRDAEPGEERQNDSDGSLDAYWPTPHDNHCSPTVLGPTGSRLGDSTTPNRRLDSTSLRDRDDASWWIRRDVLISLLPADYQL